MSAFGLQNQRIHKTPTGRIDSAFLTGADGSDVVPVWAAGGYPSLSLTIGIPLSFDLSTFGVFTDPGSPTSSLGFHTVSGQDPVSAGFGLTGTVLSNANTLATFGSFQLVAVRNGISVLSPVLAYTIGGSAGTDTVAPTVPTSIAVAPGTAAGTIALSFDPPSDVAASTTPASGATRVDVLVDGTLASPPSPVLTAANSLPSPTNVNIGTISSPDAPAFSQAGKVWTLSAAGTGIAATASEQCLFLSFGNYSGAQKFVAKLDSYASSSATALAGLMVHETGVAGGKFIAIGLRPSNGTVGLFVESRATAAAASTQVATQVNDSNGHSISGPVYVFIERAADNKTWTVSYSLNEVGKTLITTQTLTMIPSVSYGLFCTSQSVGVDVTTTIEEVSITNGAALNATVTASAPVRIQLQSVDVAGNVSALSTAVQGVPKTASTSRIKSNPSLAYIQLDLNTALSTQLARMQALKAANPWIKGFEVFWFWGQMENPALVGGAAQYDGSWATGDQTNVDNQRGFKLMDTFVNACTAMGCQFMLHWFSASSGVSAAGTISSTVWPTKFAPLYLSGSAYGANTPATNGIWGGIWANAYSPNNSRFAYYYRYWTQPVMDRMIAFMQAYGARYDSNPNVESVSLLDESVVPSDTGYTDTANLTTTVGVGKMFQAFRAAWPTTQLRWWANYILAAGLSTLDQYIAEAVKYYWSIGGPDTANESGSQYRSIAADFRYRGLTAALGDGGVRDNTVPNYVGVGHQIREVEGEDLSYDLPTNTTIANSRHIGDGVCAHIVAQANLMGATHMVWFDNTFTGPNRNRTNTAHPNLLDFMASAVQGGQVNVNGVTAGVSLTNTAYPPSWPQ